MARALAKAGCDVLGYGINPGNMKDYLSLPVVSAIGGSWIATKEQIVGGQWDAITRQAEEALRFASELRKG